MLNWRYAIDGAENAIYVGVIQKGKGDCFRSGEIARLSDSCRDPQLERESLQLVFPFVSVAFRSTSGRRGFELTACPGAMC